jgi:hypothetical protein
MATASALVVGTNSYISYADANTYFALHSQGAAWESATEDTRVRALATAARVIDTEFSFLGTALDAAQALAHPRQGGWYTDPTTGAQRATDDPETANRVGRAAAELALHLVRNPTAGILGSASPERIKIGPIEIEDTRGSSVDIPLIPSIVKTLLQPLLEASSGAVWWRAN